MSQAFILLPLGCALSLKGCLKHLTGISRIRMELDLFLKYVGKCYVKNLSQWKRGSTTGRVFFLIDALQQLNNDFPSLERQDLISDFRISHGRKLKCFGSSCQDVIAHNLFGTGNAVKSCRLVQTWDPLNITPKLMPRADWNFYNMIQKVCFSQLTSGYGPVMQEPALHCTHLLACSVYRVVIRREKCLGQHQNEYHAKGHRSEENKERENRLKTFQCSVENGNRHLRILIFLSHFILVSLPSVFHLSCW